MAGRGRPPKEDRVNTHDLARGEVQAAQGLGWQHGDCPVEPEGLMPASSVAWSTWFGAWFAYFWQPSDVPGLRQMIRLYDQVERGEYQRHGELRLMMDTYGVTPKGQQDRRWRPPVENQPAVSNAKGGRYGGLRSVS